MKFAAFWVCLAGLLSIGRVSVNAGESNAESFRFRTPLPESYRLIAPAVQRSPGVPSNPQWIAARRDGPSNEMVALGNRVVIQLDSAAQLISLINARPLELSRTISSNVFILQAPDARTAIVEAHRLSELPGVIACYPIVKRPAKFPSAYALRTDDPFFIPYFVSTFGQRIEAAWWLENRDYNSDRLGIDLNVLSAWPVARGSGITVAVADTGLEMNHPELLTPLAGGPHFNFGTDDTNAYPLFSDAFWTHGTSVAGLIAAAGNNGKGVVGVAPEVSLAGWVILETNEVVETFIDGTNVYIFTNLVTTLVSDEALMNMFQFAGNVVAVQNHSWGSAVLLELAGPTLLEKIGIENAITLGRNGLGTVMVRAAGNGRGFLENANDDGYSNDPEVITVAAVTKQGGPTDYSEAGACILVGAPGGGGDTPQGLFTLDLVGPERGANAGIIYQGDLSDYRWGVQGFSGTSASAPLVSAISALVLSTNPNLGYRDVQQIIALSARHHFTDPDSSTNGAGLVVNHNTGFGIPDAGYAVRLASSWSNRPPLTVISMSQNEHGEIPDDGLKLEVSGPGVPLELASIQSFPAFGPHADEPTPFLSLVDAGLATNVPAMDLTNKAVLILRGEATLAAKIENAAKAGAAFAVIYNSTNGGPFNFGLFAGTDFSSIPAVFISNEKGEALKSLIQTNAAVSVRFHLTGAERVFNVGSTLLVERVGVRVRTDHPLRGDVRITVRSPQGTRSVLQRLNEDTSPGPVDWTYWSTHHLGETSAGVWTVAVSDEVPGATGSLLSASLILRGTQITDDDRDGLDDEWEIANLGSLGFGPKDDPDGDGHLNAREQLTGGNPASIDVPFAIDFSWWELAGYRLPRLSWPSAPQYEYTVLGGAALDGLNVLTNFVGDFPESEWLAPPVSSSSDHFFRIHSAPR